MLDKAYQAKMNGDSINTANEKPSINRLITDNFRETADLPTIVGVKGPEIFFELVEKGLSSKPKNMASTSAKSVKILRRRWLDELKVHVILKSLQIAQ